MLAVQIKRTLRKEGNLGLKNITDYVVSSIAMPRCVINRTSSQVTNWQGYK